MATKNPGTFQRRSEEALSYQEEVKKEIEATAQSAKESDEEKNPAQTNAKSEKLKDKKTRRTTFYIDEDTAIGMSGYAKLHHTSVSALIRSYGEKLSNEYYKEIKGRG